MRRVVVTGMGVLSPMGRGVDTNWQGLIHGKSAISAVTKYDVSESPAKVAGQIPFGKEAGQFDPDSVMAPKDQRRVDPFILYGVCAGIDAMEDSGWKPETDEDRFRTGVMVGAGIGGLGAISDSAVTLKEHGPRRISPFFIPSCLINLISGQLSIKYGLYGPNHSCVTACATGTHAIGDAARLDPTILTGLLGANAGSYIHAAAHGISTRAVSSVQEEAKSISNEITTTVDIDEDNLETEGMEIMRALAVKVAGRLRKHDFYAGTVGFSAKTDDFRRRSVQQKLPDPTQDPEKILTVAVTLMHQLLDAPDGLFGQGRKVRLMSIFTANLDHGDFRQMTLEELAENRAEIEAEIRDTRRKAEKERKLQALSKTLQERFGAGTVQRGMKLEPTTSAHETTGGEKFYD